MFVCPGWVRRDRVSPNTVLDKQPLYPGCTPLLELAKSTKVFAKDEKYSRTPGYGEGGMGGRTAKSLKFTTNGILKENIFPQIDIE